MLWAVLFLVITPIWGWCLSAPLAAYDAAPMMSLTKASKALGKRGLVSETEILEYVHDASRPGQKRALAWNGWSNQLSENDRWSKTIALYRENLGGDFRQALLMHMAVAHDERVHQLLREVYLGSATTNCERLIVGASLAHMQDRLGKDAAIQAIEKSVPCLDFGIRALENFKPEESIPALAAADKLPDQVDHSEIELAIFRIQVANTSSEAERLKMYQDELLKGQYRVMQWIGQRLGMTPSLQALDILVNARKSTNMQVAQCGFDGIRTGIENHVWPREELEKRGYLDPSDPDIQKKFAAAAEKKKSL